MRGRRIVHQYQKKDLTEFAKWVAGMPSHVNPEHVHLYHRAVICKAFPAYTLETARDASARDVWHAMELLAAAARVQE